MSEQTVKPGDLIKTTRELVYTEETSDWTMTITVRQGAIFKVQNAWINSIAVSLIDIRDGRSVKKVVINRGDYEPATADETR